MKESMMTVRITTDQWPTKDFGSVARIFRPCSPATFQARGSRNSGSGLSDSKPLMPATMKAVSETSWMSCCMGATVQAGC
jgi:hypothetical protein